MPAEQDGAEDHIVATGEHAQHARPHDVQDRRRGDAHSPCDVPQPGSHVVGYRHHRARRAGTVAPGVEQSERRGRLVHVAEQRGEEPLVLLARHRPGLRHKVSERQRRRQLRLPAVQDQAELLEHRVHADVVLHQVVHAQQHQEAALGCRRDVQVHQRRAAQVHRQPGGREQPVHDLGADRVGGEVVLHHRDRGAAPHDLDRFPQALPDHGGAIDVVPVGHDLEPSRKRVQRRARLELQQPQHHAFSRTPSPFAGNQFVPAVYSPNDERLNNAMLANRIDQLLQRLRLEFFAWLQRARNNRIQPDLVNPFAGNFLGHRLCCRPRGAGHTGPDQRA